MNKGKDKNSRKWIDSLPDGNRPLRDTFLAVAIGVAGAIAFDYLLGDEVGPVLIGGGRVESSYVADEGAAKAVVSDQMPHAKP